jgi:hypothetical protein
VQWTQNVQYRSGSGPELLAVLPPWAGSTGPSTGPLPARILEVLDRMSKTSSTLPEVRRYFGRYYRRGAGSTGPSTGPLPARILEVLDSWGDKMVSGFGGTGSTGNIPVVPVGTKGPCFGQNFALLVTKKIFSVQGLVCVCELDSPHAFEKWTPSTIYEKLK